MQVVETNERGHATRFAQDAADRGVELVVAFGGDGTLNEVATGLAGSNTALMMLPGGSTNVFASARRMIRLSLYNNSVRVLITAIFIQLVWDEPTGATSVFMPALVSTPRLLNSSRDEPRSSE